MSGEMVERVARAIAYWKGENNVVTDEDRVAARAAIAAMREPSEGMVSEGWLHTADPYWSENVADAWRAMIDEALR